MTATFSQTNPLRNTNHPGSFSADARPGLDVRHLEEGDLPGGSEVLLLLKVEGHGVINPLQIILRERAKEHLKRASRCLDPER